MLQQDIAPFGEHRNDGRVGGRATDAEAFQLLHEGGFGEARRRRSEMLRGDNRLHRHRFVEIEVRQGLLIFERLPVALLTRLAIQPQESVELDDGAGGAKQIGASGGGNVKVHRGGVEHGRGHLRGHEALPDEFVQLELIGGELPGEAFVRPAGGIGWAHALVGILGVGLPTEIELHGGGQIRPAKLALQPLARRRGRGFRDARRVGTHVGNETDLPVLSPHVDAFVEILRQPHGALGTEAQLFGRFLLQRRRGEGRRRIFPLLTALHVGDGKLRPSLQVGENPLGFRSGGDFRLAPIDVMELGREGLRALLQVGRDAPILNGGERADFAFALHDDAECHGLHTPGGKPLLYRLPQDGTGFVPHQAVEHTARLLGIDLFVVDVHGVCHGFLHLVFGDLVEHDAADRRRHGVPGRLRKELFHMPPNGFPFAVRVGGDEDFARAFGDAFEFGQDVFFPLDRDVIGGEAMFDVDAQLLGWQIAHMTHRGLHREATAKVLADGLGFGG